MTSMVVLMISTITIIAITGQATDLQTDKDLLGDASTIEGCPYLDNAEYKVTVKGSVSTLIGGCAYINYNSSDIKSQSFSLWFGNIYRTMENCHDSGIEYFRFYCLSKSLSPSEDISKGRMYIRLYDDAANKEEVRDRRCAMYEKDDNDYVMTFRVVVSNNDSCDGLPDLLLNPQKIRSHKKGYMLLVFTRDRPDASLTTTTTESIQSISNRYERRQYVLQNFGSRPNPFWRTKRSEIQDSGKSDVDGRHGAVTDIVSYVHLHSDINGNDLNTGTIKEKNLLRQPLEVNHAQIRYRRSKSNVRVTYKTDVTVLGGVNPFTLILGSRVHNNSTGSIKPIGILEEIKKLFT